MFFTHLYFKFNIKSLYFIFLFIFLHIQKQTFTFVPKFIID